MTTSTTSSQTPSTQNAINPSIEAVQSIPPIATHPTPSKSTSQAPSVCVSMACWIGLEHEQGVATAYARKKAGELIEPLWGELSLAHVQLVPQARGRLTLETAERLRANYPETEFRLHANVRVLAQRSIYDISTYPRTKQWWNKAKEIQHAVGGKAYSAHSGFRADCDLQQMFDYAKALSDDWGQAVAIEGQYPDKHDQYLLSYWEEYQALLESGLPFALDLSHLNIVARQTRERNETLTQELLASENCIEIHVSDNNGTGDWHAVFDHPHRRPWWYELLLKANPDAVIFTEGNFRKWEMDKGKNKSK